jgi:hypothetical protein
MNKAPIALIVALTLAGCNYDGNVRDAAWSTS